MGNLGANSSVSSGAWHALHGVAIEPPLVRSSMVRVSSLTGLDALELGAGNQSQTWKHLDFQVVSCSLAAYLQSFLNLDSGIRQSLKLRSRHQGPTL